MAIYLDHAATTPMDPEVLEAYAGALRIVGNPSSIHGQGQQAKRLLEEAREQVAAVAGCDPIEVVFTSGGTEAVNTAVKGMFWAAADGGLAPRIVLPGGEHHATIDAVDWLVRHDGAEVDELPVDAAGRLDPDVLDGALGRPARVATVLWANNEVGTINDVSALGAVCRARGVPLHVDAVAAFGHVPVDFTASGASAMSITAHKIGGPVGVGALVLSRSATATPLVHGGGQQRGVRSGTQDVAGAIAFGTAARLAGRRMAAETVRVAALRDRLVAGVLASVPGAVLRGAALGPARLPGNAHLTFDGCDGDSLLLLLDLAGISVSTGSACQAGVPELSHVLLAMGVPEAEARGALRFTLGRTTTEPEVDALLAALPEAVARARRAGRSDRVPAQR